MSGHTKEPLSYGEDNDGWYDVRRVWACVNACAGSSTEALEEMVDSGRSVANMAMLYERAMDQRDEMLRCLTGAVMVTEDAGGGAIYLRITPEELAEIERVIKAAS